MSDRRMILAPYAATPPEVVARMLGLAGVSEADVVYDLGCGDGRLVITAAKRHGARGVCVDIDPVRIRESRANADTAGVAGRIRFHQGDLFRMDLRDATVVTLYLLPVLNERLRPKLFRELRPGSRVTSNAFDMGDWKPDSVLTVPTRAGLSSYAYYWKIPADVSGTWSVRLAGEGAGPVELTVEQRFQALTPKAAAGGRSVTVEDARIRGDSVRFVLNGVGGREGAVTLVGAVKGERMSGTASGGHAAGEWSATRTAKGARPELEPAE